MDESTLFRPETPGFLRVQPAGCDPRHAQRVLPNAGFAQNLKSHHDVGVGVLPSYSPPLPRPAKC